MDATGRDQFVQLAGDHVGIYWNNKTDDPEVIESRSKWSEFFVQWSPLGSYLATFHRQGAQLWYVKDILIFRGGDTWKRCARFAHPNVKLIDFSPCEKYVVTWSVDPCELEPGQFHNIGVWESNTGKLLRSFPFDVATIEKKEEEVEILLREQKSPVQIVKAAWPLFKWSHDDKYLARISPNGISVYETPSMGLLNKTSIKVGDFFNDF
jgi:translation initiation factor 3 subunit B